MQNNKKKRHKIKSTVILSRVVVLAFLIMLLIFININSVSYLFNPGSYEKTTATVIKPTKDEFFLLLPSVEISYEYNEQTYTERKYFIGEPFFGLSDEPGSELPLYVNTYAPNHCLFRVNFFCNVFNWILLLLMIACLYNLRKQILTYEMNHSKRKGDKE